MVLLAKSRPLSEISILHLNFDLLVFRFFGPWKGWSMPLHALALGFSSRVVVSNDTFQKMRIIFNRFQNVKAPFPFDVLPVLREVLRKHFFADLSHPKVIGQNPMNAGVSQVQLFPDYFVCYSTTWTHKIPYSVYVFIGFWSWRPSGSWSIINRLSFFRKTLALDKRPPP